MAENLRKENRFLIINTFAFIGGVLCILLNFPILGITFLLGMGLLTPISFYMLLKYNSDSAKEVFTANDYDLLKQEQKNTLQQLEECQKKLSFCEKNSMIPLYPKKEQYAYDLITFLQGIIDEFMKRNNPNNVHIDMMYEKDSIPVRINSSCMRLIFSNILDNSLKYAPLESRINITLSQVDEHILLIIKDNGVGYTIDDTMELFQLNYQGHNKLSGCGLGLTQAKAAAEACDAQIWCKTTEHKGFGVYLQFIEKECEESL